MNLIYFFFLIFSLLLLFLHKQDINHERNWPIFYLWLGNFVLASVYSIFKTAIPARALHFLKKDWRTILFIIFLAAFTRFLFIGSYPYVSIGDELRDAGLNSLRIAQGVKVDFFGFGSYQGYGNFLPLISYYFSLVFHATTLTYKIPAALVGILSIIFTFFLARIMGGKKLAIVSSLFLIFSIFHLHFSRTELVIINDSLLSLLIILAAYFSTFSRKGIFGFGLIFGISLHFYAGIRGVLIACLLYVLVFNFIRLIYSKEKFASMIKKFLIFSIFFGCGFLVGAGPTLNNLNKSSLLEAGNPRLISADANFERKTFPEKLGYAVNLYEKNFRLYFSEPSWRFSYPVALLAFPLNWLFLIGIFPLLLGKRKSIFLTGLIVFIIFFIPFANGVMINAMEGGHRFLGAVPLINIIAAFGLLRLGDKFFAVQTGRKLVFVFVLIFCLVQLAIYFVKRPSDYVYEGKEYNLQKIAGFIKKQKGEYFYILNDPDKFNYNNGHHREKMEYLDFPKKVTILEEAEFIAIFRKRCQDSQSVFILTKEISYFSTSEREYYQTDCDSKKSWLDYRCPIDSSDNYGFFVLKNGCLE